MANISIGSQRRKWGRVARVSTDDGQVFYIEALGNAEESLRRVEVLDALYEGIGGFEFVERRGVVPTNVACSGKAAIAAFLFAVHQMHPRDIADELSISKSTATQYISDVKAGRRL